MRLCTSSRARGNSSNGLREHLLVCNSQSFSFTSLTPKLILTDDVRAGLTQVFLHGNANMGVGPVLTANELAAFQERFKSVSLRETRLEECLSFYAGYPFQPLPLPLSREGLLRAVIELTGRDAGPLEQKWAIRKDGRDYVLLQGRNSEDRLRLL